MLLHLHIRNFAIVPALEQDFQAGFTAISGETGAGKSIMVDALTLLLGARSDASWVREGAERADLNAEFDLRGNAAAARWLREHELKDGDQCLLRRSIQASGRSRAWINGNPVTIKQLAELGNRLVEVHGQNEHVRLAQAGRQLSLLDETGDYGKALASTNDAFDHWQTLEARYRSLAEGAALPPSEIQFLRFQLEELENTALPPEEIAKLEQEHRLLSSAGSLMKALDACTQLLDGDDDGGGAESRLQGALAALEPFATLDEAFREVRAMLDEALINTREASASLAALTDKVDLDPTRLRAVEQQLGGLGDLARKHAVDLEALESVRDQLSERLAQASQFDELREALEQELDSALESYRKQAASLHKARQRHGKSLAKRVEALMQDLGMGGGRFTIVVTAEPKAKPAAMGTDRVELRVSANPGIEPAPLSKVASGGELSRISLAIKVATADASARTQVFDEIDAGVGGDTANAVGALLKAVAKNGQALCVTHLAQVAVRADQQLKVTKAAGKDHTSVGTDALASDERVEEIARMLGGKISEQSRAHAREMLEAAERSLQ